MSRSTFYKTLSSLCESLNLREAKALIDFKSSEFLKTFRKDLVKAIDKTNKATVKKVGVARGRNADFELAAAIDPTEKTITFKVIDPETLEVKMLVLHPNIEQVQKTVKALLNEVTKIKNVVEAKQTVLSAATNEQSGEFKFVVSLKQ